MSWWLSIFQTKHILLEIDGIAKRYYGQEGGFIHRVQIHPAAEIGIVDKQGVIEQVFPAVSHPAKTTGQINLPGPIEKEYLAERERLNDMVLKYAGRNIKKIYNVDSQVYKKGNLDAKTKELMGLVASLVLRCDDCIKYHVINSNKEGVSSSEFEEAVSIALTVGGTIVIPHLRRAFELWDELESDKS